MALAQKARSSTSDQTGWILHSGLTSRTFSPAIYCMLLSSTRADEAGAAARENWSTLGRLLHLDDDDEPTADAQARA